MARKRRAWVKVWADWYTSDSHAGLDGVALNIGPRLMLLADRSWDPDQPHADLLHPSGRPYTVAEIAAFVRFDEQDTARALAALVDVGTLDAVPSDVAPPVLYRFPNFSAYQETPDAARKRKARARNVRGQSDLFPREEEEEADAEEEDQILRVVEAINGARKRIAPRSTGLTATPDRRRAIRARLREYSLDTILAVVAMRERECSRDRSKLRYLDLVTPFRPGVMSKSIALLDAPAERPSGPHVVTAAPSAVAAIGGVE